jgi:acetylornithine/succinyldiaminopimelate/putrescine aminotransferase
MYVLLLKCIVFDTCSTFGGNPLASAVAIASLKVVRDEGLVERYRFLIRNCCNLAGSLLL